jgi:uncharacterized protein
MNSPPIFYSVLRIFCTILVGFLAAQICLRLHTPLPWMIGPLLITAALSIAGIGTLSWTPFRNAAQWTIGTALGLYFTPQVSNLVIHIWWVVILIIAWSLILGYCYGLWLFWFNKNHMQNLDRPTTYFSSLIGGASEMTILAEREHARTDLVASAHSLRVLIVTISIPFAVQWMGWRGLDQTPDQIQQFSLNGLVILGLATGVGGFIMKILGRSNAWFIGALIVSIVLTTNQIELSRVPPQLTNIAQLIIGISLGVRFNPQFIRTAPRWLVSVLIGTLLMIGFGVIISYGLGKLIHLPIATIILASAPGGIAEMAITAKVMHLGVAFVTALQACRIIAILFLAEPMYHFLRRTGILK